MPAIYTEVTLINGSDLALAARKHMSYENVKKVEVKVFVNLAVFMLAINEDIQKQLQLSVVETRKLRLPDNSVVEYNVVSPIEVHFKNRRTTCSAVVLPNHSEPVLDAIPYYDMDVLIDSRLGKLIVDPEYPGMALTKLK